MTDTPTPRKPAEPTSIKTANPDPFNTQQPPEPVGPAESERRVVSVLSIVLGGVFVMFVGIF